MTMSLDCNFCSGSGTAVEVRTVNADDDRRRKRHLVVKGLHLRQLEVQHGPQTKQREPAAWLQDPLPGGRQLGGAVHTTN